MTDQDEMRKKEIHEMNSLFRDPDFHVVEFEDAEVKEDVIDAKDLQQRVQEIINVIEGKNNTSKEIESLKSKIDEMSKSISIINQKLNLIVYIIEGKEYAFEGEK